VNRAMISFETPPRVTLPSKSIPVLLSVTLVLIICAATAIFVEPGVGRWVALSLSILLVVWMYLGRALAGTTANLISLVKNLQVKNHELIGKVKVAEETCKVKAQFLASMSHEIRTPLSAILGFVELLDDPCLPIEDHLEYLRIVRSNSEYLIKVVNDILDVSHLNSGKLTIEPKPTCATEVLSSVLSMMRIKADEKGLNLSIEYWSSMPTLILIDEARLRQILVNLVGNAIKFTPAGSVRLRVGCHTTNDPNTIKLEVVVRDSGVGIDPAERGQLFNIFSQLHSGYIDRSKGNGLGLSISKSLANMMGGDVDLLGSSPGKGSSFIFTCPTKLVENSCVEPGAAPFPSPRKLSVIPSPAPFQHQ
jgi:signal transduction histidine kinase